MAPLRILTWNLKHGRAEPPAGRDLLPDFTAALAAWPWDVALLQEVPPWWPDPLAVACGAEARRVPTSRNVGLGLRRVLATRWPDLMKSNGGGANAILVRGGGVREHREALLCRLPERRRVHAVRLEDGLWVANLHATAHHTGAAERDGAAAAAALRAWSGGEPSVLGGDFNLRRLAFPDYTYAGGHDVDHVFLRGPTPAGAQVIDRGALSDHAPVLVAVERPGHGRGG